MKFCIEKICLLFIMLTTSLVSCKFLNWKNLDIKISIEDTQEYFSNEFIEVVFSYSPNIESAEKNMKLTQDNQNIQSIYVWEGNTCKIQSCCPVNHGHPDIWNYSSGWFAYSGHMV